MSRAAWRIGASSAALTFGLGLGGMAVVDSAAPSPVFGSGLLVAGAVALVVGAFVGWRVSRARDGLRRFGEQLSRATESRRTLAKDPSRDPEMRRIALAVREVLQQAEAAAVRERQFSGNVAHELRTPLTVLKTGLDYTLSGPALEPELHTHLSELRSTVDDMHHMVDNLLLLARLEQASSSLALEPVPIRDLVDIAWKRLAPRVARRELSFDNQVPEDFHLDGDRAKLRLVLGNLLGNAASYTERGGRVEVRVDAETRAVQVWDSGPQLAPEALVRVFDRLWREDRARTGGTQHTGLGLFLARTLCKGMGLDLSAGNTGDGGLQFVVMPCSVAESESRPA